MPIFTSPIVPQVLMMPGSESAQTTAATTAGAAFLSAVILRAPATVTQMRTGFSGTPTGSVDMGVYDASGTNGAPNNLLGHTGAIAAATGLFTQNMTANLLLAPGRYWLALLDTVADSVFTRAGALTALFPVMRTSATNLTVLPSTIGTVANNGLIICYMALLLNSWA